MGEEIGARGESRGAGAAHAGAHTEQSGHHRAAARGQARRHRTGRPALRVDLAGRGPADSVPQWSAWRIPGGTRPATAAADVHRRRGAGPCDGRSGGAQERGGPDGPGWRSAREDRPGAAGASRGSGQGRSGRLRTCPGGRVPAQPRADNPAHRLLCDAAAAALDVPDGRRGAADGGRPLGGRAAAQPVVPAVLVAHQQGAAGAAGGPDRRGRGTARDVHAAARPGRAAGPGGSPVPGVGSSGRRACGGHGRGNVAMAAEKPGAPGARRGRADAATRLDRQSGLVRQAVGNDSRAVPHPWITRTPARRRRARQAIAAGQQAVPDPLRVIQPSGSISAWRLLPGQRLFPRP